MDIDDNESAFAGLGRRGLVGRMHEQLDELLAARDQMELLLRVIVEIAADLDLDATLQRIVTAAMQLTDARYGALAIRGPDGALVSFVHAGIDADTVRRIGRLPAGKGVLGVPLDSTCALRLDDLTTHPAAVGLPEHHPPMRAFLGVPITIRATVFGSLYLADDPSAEVFTESDEAAARALAAAAAVAIENAQLFERVRASATWKQASREITTTLLSDLDTYGPPLQLIAERARQLADAEQAIVLVPLDIDRPADEVDTLVVSAAVGVHAAEVIGRQVAVDGSTTGHVFRSGTPLITESFRQPIQAFTDVGKRPAIVMPLRANDTVVGVIALARNKDRPPFDTSYLDLVGDFAGHAAIAMMLAAGRDSARELTVLADRERIAHDLHDHVIRRLFTTVMDLQGTIARAHSAVVADRLNCTLEDLQTTIEDIRTSIFALRYSDKPGKGFQHRIQQVIADLTENRHIVTTVQMQGSMTAVGAELAEHAQAVTEEAISNTIHHSGATNLTVEISVNDELSIDIADDGRGITTDNQRHSGFANIQVHAEQVGGTCRVSSPPEGGTRVHWTAPLAKMKKA